MFCPLAIGRMGYPGAGVARFLGVTISSVNRLAVSEEVPNLNKYIKFRINVPSLRRSFWRW